MQIRLARQVSRENAPAYSLRSDAWKPINYTANYLSCHVLFLPCTFYLSLKQTNCVHRRWDTPAVVLYLKQVSAQLGRYQESSMKQVKYQTFTNVTMYKGHRHEFETQLRSPWSKTKDCYKNYRF